MTAVIVTGLVIGGRRERITTAQTRLQLHSVYQTVIFLLESVVFSLIGLQLPILIRDLSHGEAWPAEALAVAGTLIVTRILWVFPLSAVVQRRSGVRRPTWPVPAVVSWAGTGAVPLAAALSIPLTTTDAGTPLPQRDLILVLATAVIVISLVVQGLTLEPLVRLAGIARTESVRHEETVARLRLAEAALARLDELADDDCAADDAIDRARASLQARIGRTRARIDGGQPPEPGGLTDRDLRRALNAAEHAELARLYNDGTISQPTRLRLQHGLTWKRPGSATSITTSADLADWWPRCQAVARRRGAGSWRWAWWVVIAAGVCARVAVGAAGAVGAGGAGRGGGAVVGQGRAAVAAGVPGNPG